MNFYLVTFNLHLKKSFLLGAVGVLSAWAKKQNSCQL